MAENRGSIRFVRTAWKELFSRLGSLNTRCFTSDPQNRESDKGIMRAKGDNPTCTYSRAHYQLRNAKPSQKMIYNWKICLLQRPLGAPFQTEAINVEPTPWHQSPFPPPSTNQNHPILASHHPSSDLNPNQPSSLIANLCTLPTNHKLAMHYGRKTRSINSPDLGEHEHRASWTRVNMQGWAFGWIILLKVGRAAVVFWSSWRKTQVPSY